ncbi:MAG: hypothetical protein R3F61_00690 [Myxococcota bacterium]
MRGPALALGISLGLVLAAACEPSAEDDVQVVDLGTVSLSDTGGYSGALEVEMPALTTSAIAYCGGFGDDALGAVWTLTDPSGGVVYDGDAGDTSRFRSDFLDDLSPGLLPVSPKLPMAEGTWSFDWFVGEGNGGSLSCGAVVRSGVGDDVGDEATVKVEVVFVSGLDAASAPDDADWQTAMDVFETAWGTAGLSVDVTYKDFTGNADRFAVVDVTDTDYSEFNDLLRTADPDDGRSVTFFVVDEIANNSDGGATILGLSAGPPGMATRGRTSKSGVIVSGIDLRDAPADIGKIMAHEGGHFLGLFHPVEKDGAGTDPLDDTPVCSNDADGNGRLDNSECGGNGVGNMMWWNLVDENQTFSGDQGWVVRRNPVAF